MKNHELKTLKVGNEDESQSENDDAEINSLLKNGISKMNKRIGKLHDMSINIAADPAKAITRISDPILKLIETKTNHQEKVLQDMQTNRLRKQKRIIELKELIFNEKFKHINIGQEIESQQ